MFDIHLAYYRNIGPFQDKDIFVNYKAGRNLIKAPIGIGKSFLFFDAPIFALYKNSSRTITNKNCKNAHLQLLFTVNDRTFLIIRDLTLTAKGKDSVKTKLFTVEDNDSLTSYLLLFNKQKIVQKKSDILTDMTFNNVKFEEISGDFKTDAELQGNLNDLLPPKEVVLSTFFLMQDADNIFQSTPAERIQILKKIFGLIGIDEAKEVINDEKKVLIGQLRAKEDIEAYQYKIDSKISTMKELQQRIGFPAEKLGFEDIGEDYKFDIDKLTSVNIDLSDEKKELEKAKNLILSIEEKLKLQQENKNNKENEYRENKKLTQSIEEENENILSEINDFDQNLEKKLKKEKSELQDEIKTIKTSYPDINAVYEKYQNIQEKRKNTLEQEKDLWNKILSYKENIKEFQNKISEIQTKINQISDIDVDQLSKEKMELVSLKDSIVQSISFSDIKLEGLESPDNIASLERFIGEVETTGKSYKADIENLNNEIEEMDKDIASIGNDKNIKTKQLESSKEGVEDYFCDKINGNCPHVDEIRGGIMKKQQENLESDIKILETNLKTKKERALEKKKQLKVLEEKRVVLLAVWQEHDFGGLKGKIGEYHNISVEIEKLDKKFVDLQEVQKLKNEIGNITGQMQQGESQIKDAEKQKKGLEEDIEKLIEDGEKLGGEKLIADFRNLAENNRKIEEVNENLDKFRESKEHLQKLQIKQKNLLYKIEEGAKIKEKIKNEIGKAQDLIEELENQMQEQDIDSLRTKENDILELEKTLALYNNIIDEFSENKVEVIDLKAKITRLKNLYDLFSKELVIIVFMSYLKQLEEVLNSILANLVDFTLLFEPDDKGINLEIQAVDEKGIRLVQSLSGGQKNIIRLAWILAVSSFQNAKILFLDETVNNLDKESIGKVANFIQEFLEKNEMKFYMITHSSQLQSLDIWDDVEELEELG